MSLFTEQEELEIVRLYQLPGSSLHSLGALFGCSYGTIRNVLVRRGVPRNPNRGRGSRPGRQSWRWAGGRSVSKEGYVRLRVSGLEDRPLAAVLATHHGVVLEHRLVMAEHLGRPLRPNESVHHINGVRDDNRIENLELWVSTQPAGQRPIDLVRWAREILETYEAETNG